MVRPTLRFALPLLLVVAACDGGESRGPLSTDERAFVFTDQMSAGAKLSLRSIVGPIEIVPSPDDSLRVVGAMSWRGARPTDEVKFSADRSGGDALICAVWGKKSSCTAGDLSASFEVGPGSRSDISVAFRIELPAGVKANVSVISGDVTIAASAPVVARTLNGDLKVATAVGPVDGQSVNGDVDIRMTTVAPGQDSIVARSVNGSVFAYLPENVGARISIATTTGRVESDFAPEAGDPRGRKRKFEATVGDGAHPVVVHTVNGAAALRRLDSSGRSGTN